MKNMPIYIDEDLNDDIEPKEGYDTKSALFCKYHKEQRAFFLYLRSTIGASHHHHRQVPSRAHTPK